MLHLEVPLSSQLSIQQSLNLEYSQLVILSQNTLYVIRHLKTNQLSPFLKTNNAQFFQK